MSSMKDTDIRYWVLLLALCGYAHHAKHVDHRQHKQIVSLQASIDFLQRDASERMDTIEADTNDLADRLDVVEGEL